MITTGACCAARNSLEGHGRCRTRLRDPAARYARVFKGPSAPKRARGNAGCPVHPQPRVRWGSKNCTRVFTAVAPEITRHPRTQWFYGFLRALPGDRAFLSPSLPRSLLPENLTPASRRQNHTTSPSASGALVSSTVRVHRIQPRVRDDRDTPLVWGGRRRLG